MLAALDRTGRNPVIKPWPTRPAVEGGFTIDDFSYDDAGRHADLPEPGHPPVDRASGPSPSAPPAAAARCGSGAPPPRRPHDQRPPRTRALQRRHRQRAQDRAFQHTYRPNGRWSNARIAWLVRGNRRVPYRGVAKNNAWLHHRLAALNLRRLLTLGLNLHHGTWQLA